MKELNLFKRKDLEKNEEAKSSLEVLSDPIEENIQRHIKKVIEAMLFSSSDPLSLLKIKDVMDGFHKLSLRTIRQLIEELKQECISDQRAYRLEEIAEGYIFKTHEEYAPYLEILHRQRKIEKLSPASTEVLAIIAYEQPVTRSRVDALRGVDSSGCIVQLMERELIECLGKLEAPGRPLLYGTTKKFLNHFGLKNLTELKSSDIIANTIDI